MIRPARARRRGRRALALAVPFVLPAAFLLAWFYLPLVSLLEDGLGRGGVRPAIAWLFDPYFWRLLRFTTLQALWSSAASLLIGFPLAYLLATYTFPLRRLVRALTLVPFVLPAVVVALGFILFFGRQGPLARFLALFGQEVSLLYSLPAIVLAHAFYNAPLVTRSVHAAWERLDPALEETARALGAGPWAVFRDVTWPAIFPGVITGALFSFLFSFMSFPIVLSLGGARYTTLEVEIYTQVRVLFDQSAGTALAFWETVLALAFSSAYLALDRRWAVPARARALRRLRPWRLTWSNAWVLPYGLALATFYVGPLASIAYDSLASQSSAGLGWSFSAYSRILRPAHDALLGDSPLTAIRNSL
ncbi:MAG TPA: ABC transporter permease subunit, partial [Limnochordia bacterium]